MNESAAGMTAGSRVQQQLAPGFDLLRRGLVDDAIRLSERLRVEHPGNPEVLYFCGECHAAAGDPESALACISAAIDAAPGQLPLIMKKANLLILLRHRLQARRLADELATASTHDARALWAAGRIAGMSDDPVAARRYYERALAAGCTDPALRYDLAASQWFAGESEEAERHLDVALTGLRQPAGALYLRSTLRRQTRERNHVEDLEARLRSTPGDPGVRIGCLFALAKEFEDLGESERSFTALTEAAGLKRRALNYDAAAERAAIDATRVAYDEQIMRRDDVGHPNEGAIFIVGMPRTGTTLVERMLDRHTEVKSAGELLDFGRALAAAILSRQRENPGLTPVQASLSVDFTQLGRDYIEGVRQIVPGSRFFIDKMPINFIYCGLIRKALPNARIVHLVRDPMDTCYAVYKTLFNQAYPFSYDLDELAEYYICYHRMMQHWHAVMPGVILDVRYEDLVTDTEAQARRMLAAIDLDWQPAVLAPSANESPATTASAAQVREPVYTSSIRKWRRYEQGLAVLRARLEHAGIPVD